MGGAQPICQTAGLFWAKKKHDLCGGHFTLRNHPPSKFLV
jgi:hypothetical protein